MVRLIGILFLLLSSSVVASDKQLVCPYIGGIEGTLEGGAWRIDTFIFDPDDFDKDSPNLTHLMSVGRKDTEGSTESTYLMKYAVSPTHMSFWHPYFELSHTINRTTLEVSWGTRSAMCEISDVEVPKKRAF